MRLLRTLRKELDGWERDEWSVIRRKLLGPHHLEGPEHVVRARAAGLEVDAESLELVSDPTRSGDDDEASVGNLIQGRDQLAKLERVPIRDDERAEHGADRLRP